MNLDELKKDTELQEKLKVVKNADELVELARENGVELSDEQLESLASGGFNWEMQTAKPCRAARF